MAATARAESACPAPCPCPCGSGLQLAACCGRWHAGQAAPSALALMRSRYAAFVFGRVDYLLHTWHASTRPPTLVLEPGVRWLGLQIRAHAQDDAQATVEFVARFKSAGRATRLHETSRFVFEDGRWFYVDGTLR